MRTRRSAGLFARLTLVTVAASVVPLIALGLYSIDRNADELRISSRQLQLTVAEAAARAVRDRLSAVDGELLGIGQLLLAPGLGGDDERLRLAGSKVTASPDFEAVTLYGPDGARLGTIKAKEARDPDAPVSLTKAALAAAAPLSVGEVRVLAGAPRAGVLRAVVLEGKTRGFLLAQVDLRPICAVIGALADRLGARDAVWIIDEKARLVAHGDLGRILESQAGRGLFQTLTGSTRLTTSAVALAPEFVEDGREMLGAIQPMPELGWAAIVRVPRAVAYASLESLRRAVALFVVLAVALGALAAILAARHLARPLVQLTAATRAIAARTFRGVDPAIASRSDEVGELGRSFDTMVRDLDASAGKLVEEARVRASLSRYLSSDVVDLIVRDPARLRLAGERREVTVLFADVVAFTTLSETLPAERIVQILNELFTAAGQIIHSEGGIVDKFIGDCVMAVFGTPEKHADDPLRAVRAAERLRGFLGETNPRWKQEHGVEIHLSMGVNTGLAVAGSLGGEQRMEYTVIGDAVNVAARLQGLAGPDQIVVSRATAERIAPERQARRIGEKVLKGRTTPTELFEVPA